MDTTVEGRAMAKKQPIVDSAGKTRFELRFDSDVYEAIKKLADSASISVNQMMQGISRWAIEHGHAGEPHQNEQYFVASKPVPGCVWFGRDRGEAFGDEKSGGGIEPAEVYFSLDFTERRVVRDDWEPKKGKAVGGRSKS